MSSSGIKLVTPEWVRGLRDRIDKWKGRKEFSRAKADAYICDSLPLALDYIESLMGARLGTHVIIEREKFEAIEKEIESLKDVARKLESMSNESEKLSSSVEKGS